MIIAMISFATSFPIKLSIKSIKPISKINEIDLAKINKFSWIDKIYIFTASIYFSIDLIISIT